jgi:hypothetical protein
MSSAGGCPSWQAMVSVRTSIVPPPGRFTTSRGAIRSVLVEQGCRIRVTRPSTRDATASTSAVPADTQDPSPTSSKDHLVVSAPLDMHDSEMGLGAGGADSLAPDRVKHKARELPGSAERKVHRRTAVQVAAADTPCDVGSGLSARLVTEVTTGRGVLSSRAPTTHTRRGP